MFTDSKYGYAIHKNVIRLSLLRSPKFPDANADMGINLFILFYYFDFYFSLCISWIYFQKNSF